jgi:hypothetical protein
MDYSEIFQIVFSGLVTLSTIVYAFLTAKLVSETRKSREPPESVGINPVPPIRLTANLKIMQHTN